MRRLLLFLFGFLAAMAIQAGTVSKQEALRKAQQFMNDRHFSVSKKMTPARIKGAVRADASDGSQYFYVFNADDNEGFVIVSGDDRTVPILGYADKGHVDGDDMPENMRAWLDGYAEQLKMMGADGAFEPQGGMEYKAAIEPLIETQWNQGEPYNLMCPVYGGERCVTGCVATALAQVMYYWKWPVACDGLPGYTTESKRIKVSALPATTFEWDLMKPLYAPDETGESANEVAKLMRYAGQAIQMDYAPDGSAANINLTSMHDNFGYSVNARRAYRSVYTTKAWETLVYNELAAQRPVLYDGSSLTGGHQFVCDGYDGKGLFHINWGWGGLSDGYFILSLANPDDAGIGGGSDPNGYKFYQTAIVGFQPASSDEVEIPEMVADMNDPDPATYTRTSANEHFTDVLIRGYVWALFNGKSYHVNVDLGYGLFQDGELVEVLAYEHQTSESSENSNEEFMWNYKTATFGASLLGHYSIRPVYRISEQDAWSPCQAWYICELLADITEETLTLRKASDDPDFTVDNVEVPVGIEKGSPATLTVTLTNTGDTPQEMLYLWTKRGNAWVKATQTIGSIEPGQTGTVPLTFTPDAAGDLTFMITADEKATLVKYESELTVADVKEVTIDNLKYRLNVITKVATLFGAGNIGALVDLVVPAMVTYGGEDYLVKRIADDALWNCNDLEKLTISEGIETIGSEAFAYCFGLRFVVLPSTLTAIGRGAFKSLSILSSLRSDMATPFPVSESVFEKVSPQAMLCVPNESRALYQNTPGWGHFSRIYEGEMKEADVDNLKYSCVTGDNIAMVLSKSAQASAKGNGSNSRQANALANLTIPSTITVDDVEYRVVTIASDALYNCNDIRNLVISEGVEAIGTYAFSYCFLMQTLELPSTLTSIGDYAFCNLTRCNTVTSHITTPFPVPTNVFGIINGNSIGAPSATLRVPADTRENYAATEGWNIFQTIEEAATAIRQVQESTRQMQESASTSPLPWYNLNGQRIAQPRQGGIYVRNGQKVIVK